MMNLSEFNKLDLEEKAEYTFKSLDASFIAYRNYYQHKVTLYGCEGFFIEVFYFPEENRITRIEAIPLDGPQIDLYINASLKDK